MKLIFELAHSNVLVINEKYQGPFLAILEDAKLYKSTGYGYDSNYEPSQEVPSIKFVADHQLLGFERALEQAKQAASDEQSKYYKLYNEKNASDKLLKETQEKLASLTAAINQVTDTVEEVI